MTDTELLRKYEPTLHFTAGELFYPCAVDGYLAQCTLWRGEELILRKGEINTNVLGRYESTPDKADYHLRFVEKPLSNTEAARWRLDPKLPQFKAGGRLSRVGLASRLIDNLLDISLLIRGNVPAGTAACAELQYRDLVKEDGRDVYYGRVVREGGYVILHYLFFYVMNNWRTGFYGVNDHEADWEQIFVYLEETNADPIPRWVAYASHDFKGDDLRRRWDDPELERDGDHPIVYVGAGSHASYFQQGEYLMSVEPTFVRPLSRLLRTIQTTWRKRLGMGAEIDDAIEGVRNLIRVPFVDYARGDGESIGANATRQWFPIKITETDEWVHAYRGLWGLDTQDFVGGERAPAGAKFQRDGSVRQSWADPLGWAGLDKVSPLNERKKRIKGMLLGLETAGQELEQGIASARHRVRDLAIEVDALAMIEPNSELYARQKESLRTEQAVLQGLRREQTELFEKRHALRHYLERVERGSAGNARAHIKHTHPPEPPLPWQTRWVEIWAGLSSVLLVGALILFLLVPQLRPYALVGIGVVVLGLVGIEAVMRGTVLRSLLNLTILLAIVATGILLWEFWLIALVGVLIIFVGMMLRENLREIRRV